MFTIVYDEYEFDPIRNEAAKQLGKPLYDFAKDPVEDEYNVAEEIYNSSKYDKAIDKLFSIYKDNPQSIYASKSLYTIGYILENDLNLTDSAAVIYDILNKQYRTSEYAKAINLKLAGYNQEQKRVEAIQDSINAANEARIDSIKAVNEVILPSNDENPDSTQMPNTNNTNIDSVNSAIINEDPK